MPVNDALFLRTPEEALAYPTATIELAACGACGLVFNAAFDPALVEYSPRCIENRSNSAVYTQFADRSAAEFIERHRLHGKHVVEVGCGHDASYLGRLCALSGGTGTGIDPACDGATPPAGVQLIADRFDDRWAGLPGDALICLHTLEHVPDVAGFLAAIAAWAARRPGAPVAFELPALERVLEEGAFWDVYYEHCSYFTRGSLVRSVERAGLSVERCEYAYEGQYIVLEARSPNATPTTPLETHDDVAATVASAKLFGKEIGARIHRIRNKLMEYEQSGPVVLWQAGAKTVALLALLDLDASIAALVDINPDKRGYYVPGSAVPIVGPMDVPSLAPAHVVVMNPVYLEEVTADLKMRGVGAAVVSLEDL